MDSNEDETIIFMNLLLFTSLLVDKDINEKRNEIENILISGADVNAADPNFNDNTPLHIAVRKRERDIVKLLLQWDADIMRLNGDDKSVISLAKELEGTDSQEIWEIIKEHAESKQLSISELFQEPAAPIITSNNTTQKRSLQRANTIELNNYLKRDGTTAVSGQLYKTKMLSLVLLKASNDPDISAEKFYLGTNISGTGVFYDICLKYNVKSTAKSFRLFMQCKHFPTETNMKESDLRNPAGDWSLSNCLDSFLKIKDKFGSDINDDIFSEDYNDIECNFVLYTSSKDVIKNKNMEASGLSPKINYLINTGTNTSVFRFDYKDDDIAHITKEVQKKRILSLAQCFIDYIFCDTEEFKNMMDNQLIKTYHVVLALNMLNISNTEDGCYRTATFHPNFFQTEDPMLVLLRETLCKLTVKKYNKSKFGSEELVNLFNQLPNVPSSDEISMYIGAIVEYEEKYNKLKLMNDLPIKGFSDGQIQELTEILDKLHVTATIIKEAILKAGERKLSDIQFKVPISFGNIDVSIDKDKEDKVFDNIVDVFAFLFTYYSNTKIIELNETNLCKYKKPNGQIVTTEFLQYNNGIGSAIGNLLVLDNEFQMLKFNTAVVLPKKADLLLQRLKKVVPIGDNIEYYRLKLDLNGFPRISFNNNDYDSTLARYFLSQLWFYTDQEKENKIDVHIKSEIKKYYKAHKGPAAFELDTHIDSIYSTFHDEIQKWWMVTPEYPRAPYLTQESKIFRCAQEGVVDVPLLTLHHQMYLAKMKSLGIQFVSDSIENLPLEDTGRLVRINTDCDILTAIKLHQLYKGQNNYNFMDFNYLLGLPDEDRFGILTELKQTIVDTLIIICGNFKTRKPINEDLDSIIKMFKGNKVVLVIANNIDINMKLGIPYSHYLITDDMNDFTHFDEESQETFARTAMIVFQGNEVSLSDMVDDTSMSLINAKILYKLINNERIEIGKKLITEEYEKIQDCYVPRWVENDDSEDAYLVNSLDSIKDSVVLLISKHGMGKRTLFTHIALETKKSDPAKWIVYIDLYDYFDDFFKWERNKININKCDVIEFLCKASLKHIDRKTVLQLEEVDGKVSLNTSNITDELKIFETNLFLHYYNERKITFLFYHFDHICPPYEELAIGLLKTIETDGVPMWVASHLVEIPVETLEDNFGKSYKLRPIDETGQKLFFKQFWKANLQLENLNSEIYNNVGEFLEFMTGKDNLLNFLENDRLATPWVTIPVHIMYLMALDFFKTELSNVSFHNINSKLKECWNIDLNLGHTLATYLDECPEAKQAAELAGTPLHMYVAANYFIYRIKGRFKVKPDVPEIRKKWDLFRDVVGLYERFVLGNMNKVFCESDSLEIDEDVEENKRKEFFERHKNVVLLTLCKEDHLNKLLPTEKISELKNTLNRVQKGEEKSPFLDCVLNDVPKFFHLMYAEYCAVEYLCDILKGVQRHSFEDVRHTYVWDFIVNVLLYTSPKSVRIAFDYKIKHDPELTEITSSESCKNIIFQLLLREDSNSEIDANSPNPLQAAFDSGMNNLVKVILTSLDVNLNKEYIKSSVKLLQVVDLAVTLYNSTGGNMPTNLTNFFTDMKLSKFIDVLNSDSVVDMPIKLLSKYLDPDSSDKVREELQQIRQRLIEGTENRFGLSQENIQLFRRLAERIRNYPKD